MNTLIRTLREETLDPEEDTFLLFSQPIPSQNLGFVDPKATSLTLAVAGRDFVIHQSPSVLSSSRAGGTTGAVLWKITPLFAEWLASPSNILFRSDILSSDAAVLELGCGISALTALAVAPLISRYILTDQNYVSRFVEQNLLENRPEQPVSKRAAKTRKSRAEPHAQAPGQAIEFRALDWEQDEVTHSLTGSQDVKSFDAVIACDCIYNDMLIQPLVQTCVDVCKLRAVDTTKTEPCVCVVAQQLRNPEVFEAWLTAFHAQFRVWQVDDSLLPDSLRSGSGFVLHVGVLRDSGAE